MINLLTTYSEPVSVIIRILSLILMLAFCIPLQIKEAGVKNGLRALRIQLLLFGLTLLLTNLFSLGFLWIIDSSPQRPLNAALQVINALAFLALAVLGHKMYTSQYTEENKMHHEEIAKMEKTHVL